MPFHGDHIAVAHGYDQLRIGLHGCFYICQQFLLYGRHLNGRRVDVVESESVEGRCSRRSVAVFRGQEQDHFFRRRGSFQRCFVIGLPLLRGDPCQAHLEVLFGAVRPGQDPDLVGCPRFQVDFHTADIHAFRTGHEVMPGPVGAFPHF